jgi:lipid A 3-O-deacylase
MKINFFIPLLFGISLLSMKYSFGAMERGKDIEKKIITQQRHNQVCKWGILNPPECRYKIIQAQPQIENSSQGQDQIAREKAYGKDRDCRWGIFNPPKCRGLRGQRREIGETEYEEITKSKNSYDSQNNNISIYSGTFDVIDKEGDDKTSLIGLEHKNTNLFRNTFIGSFTPITGGFITGQSSTYLYTGIEGQYNIGPLKILPSFAPGYYEAGDGKNLGSALEFKSQVKFGLDLFKGTNLGYSYSHISNNDWGDVNPGVDNQSVTFSKKF